MRSFPRLLSNQDAFLEVAVRPDSMQDQRFVKEAAEISRLLYSLRLKHFRSGYQHDLRPVPNTPIERIPVTQCHSPNVQPPSRLILSRAALSARTSSSVNLSCPNQFALLVRDLKR